MKKSLLILVAIFSMLLVSCGSGDLPSTAESIEPVSVDAFSSDEFVIYAAKGNFKEGVNYTLQFSANMPKSGGVSTIISIKSLDVKASENTKLITDAILVSDIQELIAPNGSDTTKVNINDFEYNISVFDTKKLDYVDSFNMYLTKK